MFTSTTQDWQLPPYRKKHCIDCLGVSMSIPKPRNHGFGSIHVSTYEYILKVDFHQVIYFNA